MTRPTESQLKETLRDLIIQALEEQINVYSVQMEVLEN